MDPKEIAKYITDDPDVMENLRAVELGPSKKAQSRKRKRRLDRIKKRHEKEREFEKDKSEYEVDKISGQPKHGKILYSDIPTENPVGITESLFDDQARANIGKGIKGAGRAMQALIKSPWDRGEWQSGVYRQNVRTLAGFLQDGYTIARKLRNTGFTHSNTKSKYTVCQYLVDLERFKEDLADAKTSVTDGGPSPIAFPRGEWWGQYNWSNPSSRKKYLQIFEGEVMIRFLGMVELQRDKHAAECKDRMCARSDHIEYVAREILCNGKVRLQTVYDVFNRARAEAIKAPKSKTKSKKLKFDEPRGRKVAQVLNPTHNALATLERKLFDKFGTQLTTSGMPRVPIYKSPGFDWKTFARRYVDLAAAYFGDKVDINKLWQESQ